MSRARCGRYGEWGGIRTNAEAGIDEMHAGNDKVALQCEAGEAGQPGCLSSWAECFGLGHRVSRQSLAVGS